MALQLLKNLVKKNIETPNEEKNSNSEKNDNILFGKKDKQSYEDWGFEMSQKQKGSKNAYAGCWSLVRDYFRKKEGEDEGKRQADINKAKGELEKKEVEIEQKKSLFSNIEKKIEELNKDIFKIKENPEEILKDSASKVSFIIGLTILIGLTIYLFMFYSSASYSAFFKDFTPDDTKVATAIFDAHALSKSLEEGVLQLILILTIPFAFLGLGYLIHKFQEQEGKSKYFKIGGFLLVTFIFDFILAYGITKQIYDIERMNDITGKMPEYSISLAFTNVHFWIIIFAGFVVYLIWGSKEVKNNRSSYLLPTSIQANGLRDNNWKEKFEQGDYGFITTQENLEVLVLEVNPSKNALNDEDVIKAYFEKWFKEMKVSKFQIYNSDLPEFTKKRIENFINNN